MRRILFVKELGKRQGQGAGPEYKAGSTHTFTGHVAESYAQAYIERGFAVEAPSIDAPVPIAVAYDPPEPKPVKPKAAIAPVAAAPVVSVHDLMGGTRPRR